MAAKDVFDSTALTHSEMYYHQFKNPGTYRWGVFLKGGYTIQVTAGGSGQPAAHEIGLEYADGAFSTQSPNLSIYVNDNVGWQVLTPDTDVPSIAIVGDNGGTGSGIDGFDSQLMGVDDAYSHIFSEPGDYSYTVFGVTNPGLIQVLQRVPNTKAAGFIVTIPDATSPTPPTLQIHAGDSVVWQVDSGTSVAIRSI